MTSERLNGQRVVLARYPKGALQPSDFAVEDCAAPAPSEGEFLVRTHVISVDPMLRLFIDRSALRGGHAGPAAWYNHPRRGGGRSGCLAPQRFCREGDLVEGRFGWQHYAISNGAGVNRVNPALGPLENALGIGGLPGFTAYVGLEAAGGVKPGQTILVSGAAGAVGSAVGALMRARGGRAVAIAGGQSKRGYLIDEGGL